MSSASARLIFAFFIAINFLLWSQSRYAIPDATLIHGDHSLVKRISYELLHPQESQVDAEFLKQCRPLAYPQQKQCKHVRERCPASHTFISVNYLKDYFCISPNLRPLVFTSLVIWLIFLFSTLGITASEFFTPNLATIAQLLGLDENVAGVTFLAFGNGSPDVFSTFSAMRAESGSLAIGELLGAATFIVSCVVGSMCVIKPFRVHPGPFLRDVGFFTAAVSLLLVILWDGSIRFWEAALLIALYVFYVALVVVGTWWERRQETKRNTEAVIRAEYENDPNYQPYRDEAPLSASSTISISVSPPSSEYIPPRPVSMPNILPRVQTNISSLSRSGSRSRTSSLAGHTQMPSFSLVGAFEFRHVVNSLQHQAASTSLNMFESPVTPYAGGHYHSHPASRQRTPRTSLSSRLGEPDPWDAAASASALNDRLRGSGRVTSPAASPVISEEPGHMAASQSSGYFDRQSAITDTTVPTIIHTSASPTISENEPDIPLTGWKRVWYVLRQTFHTLFPSLHHFKSQGFLGQIVSLFVAPAVLALTLTLPVVVTPYRPRGKKVHDYSDDRLLEFEEEGEERVLIAEEETFDEMHQMEFNKWLMLAQCAIAPVFCVAVVFNGTRHFIPLLIGAAAGGFASAVLVAVFANKGDHPTLRMIRCFMGFLVAIVWIMAIADEVVNVLQTFGYIFGLSDAIIGLTIFAIGNSLADLVANMSVAVFAPIMGFSACFGGPMLNILLGVGVSGIYIIQQTSVPYQLHFSTTLLVSTVGLLILLVATLLYVPLNDYMLTRRWGVLLIVSYVLIMTINVVVELRGGSQRTQLVGL